MSIKYKAVTGSTPVSVCQWSRVLSGLGSVFGWTDQGREGVREGGGGVGRAGHNDLLPAVSSLTLHFLPTHTLTGTAAITARRLQEHKIWLISLTNQSASQPHSLLCWHLSPIWTVWGSPDLELCDCELNIQEFPFQLLYCLYLLLSTVHNMNPRPPFHFDRDRCNANIKR